MRMHSLLVKCWTPIRATSKCAAILGFAAIALIAQPSLGQTRRAFKQSLTGSGGIFNIDRGTGISLTGGFLYANEYVGFALLPIDVGILPVDQSGQFRSETVSGNKVCRNHSTGEIADEGHCVSQMVYAISGEALAAAPIRRNKSVGVGVGYRVGSASGLYGIGSAYVGPINGNGSRFTLRLGKSFFDLGFGGTIKL